MALRARGFTLIEILVVMVVLVIVLGMIGLKVGGDEARAVREESERLALLLQTAQQEAILQGRELALTMQPNGYQFLARNEKHEFVPLAGDDMLRARELPPAVSIQSLLLDDAAASLNTHIILYPTGELLQSFVITLAHGESRWLVEGSLDGVIKPVAPNA